MQNKSKRIFKNSIALYARMLFTMLISLYTSRILLDALGIDDYGIYNVVGGIAVIFSFLSMSMSLSVSRFLGIAMGEKDDAKVSHVFSASVNIHIILSVVIAALTELFGLLYINKYINVPMERLSAVYTVFHLSVAVLAVNVIKVPFVAAITISEHINVYAILTVLESILKMLIVYILYKFHGDKLELYGVLILLITIVMFFLYYTYSRKNYSWCRFRIFFNKELYSDLIKFAGFNVFGNMIQMAVDQGQNMLLNFVFGPAVNAARGIAFHVNSALKGLVVNVFTAVNPQLFKSYGEKNFEYMQVLLYNSARLSFSILLMISLPIILDIEYVLNLWLVDVPNYTSVFIILLLINSLVYANIQPLMLAIHATAQIGRLHIYTGLVNLLNIVISYFLLKRGYSPEWVFIVQIGVSCGIIAVTLQQMKRTLGFSVCNYLIQVYGREIIVLLMSLPIPFLYWKNVDVNFMTFVILVGISVISVGIVTIYVGIEKKYREKIISTIKSKIYG